MDADAVKFGEVLRRERLARGWTLRKLAQRAGMNARNLGVVEAGGNVPSLATVLEVAEVLGADAGAMVREVAVARRIRHRRWLCRRTIDGGGDRATATPLTRTTPSLRSGSVSPSPR